MEMETKLDLAIAYQEIGDKEGARELLDEVIKGGSSDQVAKANAMNARAAGYIRLTQTLDWTAIETDSNRCPVRRHRLERLPEAADAPHGAGQAGNRAREICQAALATTCAGRTDTGVHASNRSSTSIPN
jgi:FimV-like protein